MLLLAIQYYVLRIVIAIESALGGAVCGGRTNAILKGFLGYRESVSSISYLR